MNTFKTLRRSIILVWTALVIAFGMKAEARYHLYDKSRTLGTKLWQYSKTLANYQEDKQKISAQFEGRIVKLLSQDTVQLEDAAGFLYNLKLAGIESPSRRTRLKSHDSSPYARGRTLLQSTILSNHVQIAATHINANRTGVALVYIDNKNINVEMVKAGWAQVDRRNLDQLPTPIQFELENAEAIAKSAKSGIWEDQP